MIRFLDPVKRIFKKDAKLNLNELSETAKLLLSFNNRDWINNITVEEIKMLKEYFRIKL